ncbi:hypothetical protein B0T25DRAFT_225914 [Lasiosphaeria hispida]|uniref:Uncharacterized protein n=1 Tax=Lasiosphaeria hispida TaxID=260671 RepID=A0AAJ0HD50_9PEZI|nr:hypothetical protein B0T25DRAFT_225914 [Lasiosphaeria hispida]
MPRSTPLTLLFHYPFQTSLRLCHWTRTGGGVLERGKDKTTNRKMLRSMLPAFPLVASEPPRRPPHMFRGMTPCISGISGALSWRRGRMEPVVPPAAFSGPLVRRAGGAPYVQTYTGRLSGDGSPVHGKQTVCRASRRVYISADHGIGTKTRFGSVRFGARRGAADVPSCHVPLLVTITRAPGGGRVKSRAWWRLPRRRPPGHDRVQAPGLSGWDWMGGSFPLPSQWQKAWDALEASHFIIPCTPFAQK